jgi:hypothetical protein
MRATQQYQKQAGCQAVRSYPCKRFKEFLAENTGSSKNQQETITNSCNHKDIYTNRRSQYRLFTGVETIGFFNFLDL